jgi:hypothetical protein
MLFMGQLPVRKETAEEGRKKIPGKPPERFPGSRYGIVL